MKNLKKPSAIRTVFFFCALLLSLAAVASAQPQGTCSTASAAGTWGFTDTGTLILPTGPVLFAAVGTITGDAHGNFSGTQTSSVGGRVSKETFTGTGTVNSDCTGTATFSVYDESGTTLLRTATFSVVFVDNGREEREIATSLVLEPTGTRVPAVITGSAKKLFPNSGDERNEQSRMATPASNGAGSASESRRSGGAK
jgi:hypothetical protein